MPQAPNRLAASHRRELWQHKTTWQHTTTHERTKLYEKLAHYCCLHADMPPSCVLQDNIPKATFIGSDTIYFKAWQECMTIRHGTTAKKNLDGRQTDMLMRLLLCLSCLSNNNDEQSSNKARTSLLDSIADTWECILHCWPFYQNKMHCHHIGDVKRMKKTIYV